MFDAVVPYIPLALVVLSTSFILFLFRANPKDIIYWWAVKSPVNLLLRIIYFIGFCLGLYLYHNGFDMTLGILEAYYLLDSVPHMFVGYFDRGYHFVTHDLSSSIRLGSYEPSAYTFINIYKEVEFFTTNFYPKFQMKKDVNLMNLLIYLWILWVLTLLFFWFFKVVVKPISHEIDKAYGNGLFRFSASNTKSTLVRTTFKMQIAVFVILIIFAGLGIFDEPATSPKRMIPLPSEVAPNKVIMATPIALTKIYRTDQEGNRYDSGSRKAVFKFEKGFEVPVYLKDKFYAAKHPGYYEFLLLKIKNKTSIPVNINKKLRISIAEQNNYVADFIDRQPMETRSVNVILQITEYTKNRGKYGQSFELDSGYREVIFTPNSALKVNSYKYHILEKPGLEAMINQHIKSNTPVNVAIYDDNELNIILNTTSTPKLR